MIWSLIDKLMMMLRCVALFRVEFGSLGEFSKGDRTAAQGLRELFPQQHFVLALRQQRDGIAPSSAFFPMPLALGIGVANPPDAGAWNPLHYARSLLRRAHKKILPSVASERILPRLARRNAKHGSGLGRWRWVEERTFAWLIISLSPVAHEKRSDM
jgi:hypothetical protein